MAPAALPLYPSDRAMTNGRSSRRCRRPSRAGAPRTVDLRVMLDGIFHAPRGGCQWRPLPREYGPWSTAHGYFPRVAPRLDVGAGAHDAARTAATVGRAAADAQRGHPGQPIGQDHGAGGMILCALLCHRQAVFHPRTPATALVNTSRRRTGPVSHEPIPLGTRPRSW